MPNSTYKRLTNPSTKRGEDQKVLTSLDSFDLVKMRETQRRDEWIGGPVIGPDKGKLGGIAEKVKQCL